MGMPVVVFAVAGDGFFGRVSADAEAIPQDVHERRADQRLHRTVGWHATPEALQGVGEGGLYGPAAVHQRAVKIEQDVVYLVHILDLS